MGSIALLLAAAVGQPTADGRHLIFDGKSLKGWHFSRTVHHGSTGDARVENGEIVLRQRPYGQGGLLLSDRRYKNFDLYMEVFLPLGCNSGLFLRSTEGGAAYQVELVEGNVTSTLGALIGEGLQVSDPVKAPDIKGIWRTGEWNSVRVRMDGDAQHVTLWINDKQMWDVQQTANNKVAGETDGHVGLQLHWSTTYDPAIAGAGISSSWKPGVGIRFRNIAIKELP